MKTYQSFSSEDTRNLGAELARKIKPGKGAVVFAMRGDLGAGKTTFVQGFFKGIGIKKRPTSPTFIIMRRHALRHRHFRNIFHVDAYRLKTARALHALGFKKDLEGARNIILVEWADRVKSILPKNAIWLAFKHGKREGERSIMIKMRKVTPR